MDPRRAVWTVAVAALLAGGASAQVVLKVNSTPITAGQLGVAKYKAISDTPALADDDAKATRAAVDLLITNVLLADAGREAGLTVTKKQVNQGLETIKAQLGGRAAAKELLRQIGATEEDVLQAATWRRLADLFVSDRLGPSLTVSEEEAKAYYDTHADEFHHFAQARIRGVFVSAPPGISEKADADAKARATEAERRILAGEEFANVARDLSDDMSKANGGELGWMDAGYVASLASQFGADFSTQEAGDTSTVLRGKFGYWVVQLVAKRPAGSPPFDEIKDVITKRLHETKVNEAVAATLRERRAAATIEALDPAVKAAL
jgi:parvulin-like peptidyl-prolyl isomerase